MNEWKDHSGGRHAARSVGDGCCEECERPTRPAAWEWHAWDASGEYLGCGSLCDECYQAKKALIGEQEQA